MGLDLTGLGSVAALAKSVVERFLPEKMSDGDKAAATLQLQELLQKREDAVIEAKRSIIVAEMNQGDNFTKRARPMIVYAGLAFIGLVHVIFPIAAWMALLLTGKPLANMPELVLPTSFWTAWGGVTSIWVIGRSAEKKGVNDANLEKVVRLITGSKG